MPRGISVPVVQSGLEASIQQGVRSVGQINIPVNVDPSAFKNLAQPLGRVSGLATEFEKSIAASNARVLAFGASVGIINGVQNAFSDLVKTGIEVQKTLADIAAISGQGGKQLSQFGDALFEVGKNTGQSFKTAAQAALEFSRQGLSAEETLKRTTDALTLTRFTSLNAAEAVDVLTAAANSFGETGITTAQIINKLVAVDTKFAVSAEDLANGLARAGSIAQEVGVNFDELNAAITVAQERTARGGAVIGNALKTIFTRLRSDETVQALRDIGVESLNAQGQLKGAIPLLQEVAQKIQGLSGGERIQILEAVASKYNINILSSLLDDLNNANSKFTQAVGVSAGASNQAYERQIELNKTLAAQINAASVSVTQLFNKLSQIGVTDSLATLLKFVSDLINGFNKLVDSEGLGGNIAKGLVKGISDVFFTIGLPIIGAIFIKLTKDIAQFGVESLKTILGINQQVRERQALEQAVVNTLIRDQEIMASILALSGNRAKQEEYLLGVYNRQLNALQQVQNIAKSVTPALMAGGLSATTGQIQKRGAGGYLPAQEAADIRRGVGGASASSRVVSIPNFAFGGGKRGTMIANTSEYIVPNFANGGSAIFNKDMARAYGLPAGARKISAANGYVPNFAAGGGATWRTGYYVNAQGDKITQPKVWNSLSEGQQKQYSWRESYKDLTGKTLSAMHSGGAVMLLPTQEMADRVNDESMNKGVKPKEFKDVADFVKFRAYGFSGSRVKNQVKSEGANEGVAIASIAENVKKVITNEGARVVNLFKPLTKTPISGDEFEKFYDEKGGAAGAAAGVAGSIFEAAMDYSFNNKKSRAAQEAIAAAEANNITFDVLNFKQARTLKAAFGASGSTEAFADYKISPERARTFADQIIKNNVFAKASSGYIPNFAAGSPLGDAINREMAAGVSPNKIRITQDGRLRNAGNPDGLAVINTRDEPNGRVPNFVRIGASKTGYESNDPSIIASGGSPVIPKSAQDAMIREINNLLKAFQNGTVNQTELNDAVKNLASQNQLTAQAEKKLQKQVDSAAAKITPAVTPESSKKFSIGMDKMFVAMSATMMATSTLEATLGKTDSAFGKMAVEAGKMASSITQFASLGSLIPGAGIYGAIGGAVIGAGMYGYQALTEPSRIAAEQRMNVREQELTPQGDLDAQIKQIERDLGRRRISLEKAQRDVGVFSEQYAKQGENMFSSSSGPAQFLDEAKDAVKEETEQVQKLENKLRDLAKTQRDAAAKRAADEAKAKKELEDRVALSEQIGKISINYAKGEANALVERAKKYAEITQNASNLTEVEKRRAENVLKIADIEEKIKNIGKETLFNLVKEVADKSKLANISKAQIEDLKKRFETNQKSVDLEAEALKLGIQGASNLRALLLRASENAKVAEIKLKAEKEALETQLKATEAGSLQATQIKNRLALLDAEFSINEQIAESQRRNRIEQEQFDRGSALRSLKKQIAAKPFATPQEQARLAILEEDTKYTEEVKKIDEDLNESRRKNFINFQEQLISQVKANEGITKSIKPQIVADLQRADSIDKISEALSKLSEKAKTDEDQNSIELTNELLKLQIKLLQQRNTEAANRAGRLISELQNPKETAKRTRDLLAGTVSGGMYDAFADISKEASAFSETFGKNTTIAFRDGLRDAMSAAISQTDDLNAALQNVAINFLKTMQGMFINQAANSTMMGLKSVFPSIFNFAKGGLVNGGSGYRDDVPAMLTGGEFVMRKSTVQKYGAANLAKMNNGGIFLPGVRGGGAISGYDALRAFANQTTTSGATDVLRGGGSSAFINLEDQSARLSRFGLLNEDTINQEIRSAQEQGLNIIAQREAYRTQQRKAFQQQLVGTILSAAASYGVSKLIPKGIPQTLTPGQQKYFEQIPNAVDSGYKGTTQFNFGEIQRAIDTRGSTGGIRVAYGGMIRRYASGGPTDDIPALLMSGEYIMNRGATSKYGKRLLDSMNQGRAPRFADGGEVGATTTSSTTETTSKMTGDVNISINVSGQGSQTEAQGNTNQGGIDYKKMSERIKAVVLETINEEKRLGGALRSR